MDIITKNKPDLINHKTIKQLNKLFANTAKNEPVWEDNLANFYNSYIKPNLFPLIIFVILGIFLTIKYYLNQNNISGKKSIQETTTNNKKYAKKLHSIKKQPEQIQEQVFHMPEYEDSVDMNDDEHSIHNLHKEYETAKEQYKGIMSDEMIREMYESKSARSSFDDLAKIVSSS